MSVDEELGFELVPGVAVPVLREPGVSLQHSSNTGLGPGEPGDVDLGLLNKTNGRRRPGPHVERPCRWWQRWFDDPPVGTAVLGHDLVIYLGDGRWQPPART